MASVESRHKKKKGRGSGNKRKRNEKDDAPKRRPPPDRLEADTPISELTPQQRCDLIAELSEAVLEDPTSAFTSARSGSNSGEGAGDDGAGGADDGDRTHSYRIPSKMRRLIDLADPSENGRDENTARLACLSVLAVFQDVLPTYRIRLPTAAERSVRVSKETKKLWDYERNLLTHYQLYLKLLERTWTSTGKGEGTPSSLSVTAILCLCELLKAAPHFNFRSNIMAVVVRQMNNRACDEVCFACCGAIEAVFASDAQGEVALEAARMVAKMTKERNFAVRPEVLKAFLALPLRVHEDEAQAAKIAAEAKSKKRKKDEESAAIESEMREGDATVDKIVLARAQADTLHAVTLTYFRVLKSESLSDSKVADLLPPALEGLAKIAHLINMDTVVDLLSVLKEMLKRVDALPLDAALNCILTSFQTLQGPGREMQIDQKEYVTPLYGLLPRLCTDGNSTKHTELALKCLYAAFIKRREYSTVRTAAFVKQLCTVSLHAPAQTSAPLLAFVRQLLQRYPSVHQLLENEQDTITSGAYTPTVEDPEHANPFATSAWELATMRFHVHPAVSGHAVGAAAQRMLQLPAEAPDRICADLLRDSTECYVSYKMSKRKHPLRAGGRGSEKRRQQIRFITPRKTSNHHLK